MFFGGSPFSNMPGFHPGMGETQVDNNEYYEILGVDKNATPAQIKKAFRKLAMKEHPDRGGDEEKFKKIQTAYEVLQSEEKRDLYDKYGKEGVEQGGGASHHDIFSSMFGGGGGGGARRPQMRKGESISHPLKCSLEDLYNGKTVKLAINRKVPSDKESKPRVCTTCNGSGFVMKMRQIGPGMIQQSQTKCTDCNGSGYIGKLKKERKILEVLVEKGMKNNEKIKFQGEADNLPGHTPGDVIFVIQERKHSVFKRKGNHLIIEKSITLSEALTGCSIGITHLDGRKLHIKTKENDVIKPGMFKRIPNEGMPVRGNPFVKGNLILIFSVKFPKPGVLTDAMCKTLIELLPDKPRKVNLEDPEEYELEHCTQEMLKEDMEQNREAYDSDDEQEGARQVQCQQS